jgi:hypothetical protein
MGTTPDAIANTLAFVQMDLMDAEFRRHALASAKGMRDGIKALVGDAVAAGELRQCHPARLAAALHATMNGSILNWAVERKGSLVASVRRDLTTVLAPHRASRRRRARRKPSVGR